MSQDVKMECNVYLATPEPLTQMTANSYPLYFLQFGTGLAAVGDPYAKVSLDKWFNLDGKDALLMLNKPGMSFDPSAPGKTVINHSYFDYYTPNNLITCAKNALIWANKQLNNTQRPIILWGHSE